MQITNTKMSIIIGNGIPKIAPPPMKLKVSERFEIGRPLLKIKAKPRAIVMVPSVTINGAILLFVTTKPLKAPIITPANKPIIIGTITG